MELHISRQNITGKIELLGFTEDVRGILSKDGSVYLVGKLKSSVREIEYIGTGYIRKNTIELQMTNKESCYLLTGIQIYQEEGE